MSGCSCATREGFGQLTRPMGGTGVASRQQEVRKQPFKGAPSVLAVPWRPVVGIWLTMNAAMTGLAWLASSQPALRYVRGALGEDNIVDYLESYRRSWRLPAREGVEVHVWEPVTTVSS